MATQRTSLRARRPKAARRGSEIAPLDARNPSAQAATGVLTPQDAAAKLAALGCDPLAIMAELAMDRTLDPKLRAAMAKDLAAYQLAGVRDAGDEPAALPPLGEVIAAAWRKPASKAGHKGKRR